MNYTTIICALLLASSNLFSMNRMQPPIDHKQENANKMPEHLLLLPTDLAEEFSLKYKPPFNCNEVGRFLIKKKVYQLAQQWLLPALNSKDLPTKHAAVVQLTTIPEDDLQTNILSASTKYTGNTFKERIISYFTGIIIKGDIDANYFLALLYYKDGNPKKAQEALCSFLEHIRQGMWVEANIFYLLAKIFLKLGALDYAESALTTIAHPISDDVRIKLAFIAQKNGDLNTAYKHIEETKLNNPKALLLKARLLKQDNKLEQATTVLLKISDCPSPKYQDLANAELVSMLFN